MADPEQLERLKAGVEGWNEWRTHYPQSVIDLAGADLRNVTLNKISLNFSSPSAHMLIRPNLIGVNLQAADLSGADLTGADLTGADLTDANLSRANMTVVSLRDALLIRADLTDADLGGTELENSICREASFAGVNFAKAQAHNADFSKANFTGAHIQPSRWPTANFLEAHADFIYYDRDLTKKFTDRRPHSGNFKPGEFAALFQQALDTLDLIFLDGIDWQAFFASFQELRQQYGDSDLNIQAIEKKGGSFVVRLEMSEEANKAAIEQSAKAGYDQQLQLIEARYQAQLQGKDEVIEIYRKQGADMTEIAKSLANRPGPTINMKTITMADNKSSNQTNYGGTNFQNDISGGEVNQAETINVNRSSLTNNMQGAKVGNFANQMSGNAQQIYNEASDKSLAEAAQEIQALLDQLSETYPSETRREKFDLAEVAAEQAKANLTLWQRIVSAIDAGTIAAVGELLSHPAATFFIEAAKDLAETKPQG